MSSNPEGHKHPFFEALDEVAEKAAGSVMDQKNLDENVTRVVPSLKGGGGEQKKAKGAAAGGDHGHHAAH